MSKNLKQQIWIEANLFNVEENLSFYAEQTLRNNCIDAKSIEGHIEQYSYYSRYEGHWRFAGHAVIAMFSCYFALYINYVRSISTDCKLEVH